MNIDRNIAKTYVFGQKRLTFIAVLGVVIGMSVYTFMNCMIMGFDRISYSSVFKSTPHIRLYKDDEVSRALVEDSTVQYMIVNPKIVPNQNRILNPKAVKEMVAKFPEVKVASEQVSTNVFYINGKSQLSGLVVGLMPDESNELFDMNSIMVDGSWESLKGNPNNILIGVGVAKKMSLRLGDNINLTSSKSVNRNLKVSGIFKTSNAKVDNITSYVNLSSAQQLLQEQSDYVTDININLHDFNKASEMSSILSQMTGYKAESFEQSNETLMTANKMRKIVITFISITILLVGGFGIYNILNMTVSQKINDIAILKAMGFKGKDVIRIFVSQAITIGLIGVVGGLIVATIVIFFVKKIYIGGDVGYFPIRYEPTKYIQGVIMGLVITFLAGYFPARKAAKVDPVDIFRK